ncbi:TauD/TfdA dioxygenase family protein [Frankia tisae]|uniref:TauD/TfdA dioxygenase family protein n=1 Tax=Frankia tisae TaxID=2950104 RepID=UPI0021BF19E3|nr:TauD/TfdA family dioxygenase [Frankia tisae]
MTIISENPVEIEPLGPALGATVRGIDLSRRLDDTDARALRAAWLRHGLLVLPDQRIGADELVAFGQAFGRPLPVGPAELPLDAAHPEILALDHRRDLWSVASTEIGWHREGASGLSVPAGVLARPVALPDVGGDTLFASAQAAYDRLSDPVRTLVDDLRVVHPAGLGRLAWEPAARPGDAPAEHPVVQVHPETGRRWLFVAPGARIVDLAPHESDEIVALLVEEITRPEHVLRHRWEPGTVLVWDNRWVLHQNLLDYGQQTRIVHQVVVEDGPWSL